MLQFRSATVLNAGKKEISPGVFRGDARSKAVGWVLYLTVCSLFQSVIQQPGQPDSGLSKPGSDNRAGFLHIIVGEFDR
jgi:hypothetical protein